MAELFTELPAFMEPEWSLSYSQYVILFGPVECGSLTPNLLRHTLVLSSHTQLFLYRLHFHFSCTAHSIRQQRTAQCRCSCLIGTDKTVTNIGILFQGKTRIWLQERNDTPVVKTYSNNKRRTNVSLVPMTCRPNTRCKLPCVQFRKVP